MSITPDDVRTVEFKTVRLSEGYDPDQVDSFLDGVEQEMISLQSKVQELETAKRSLENRLAQQPARETSPAPEAVRLLEAAQATADKLVADVERDATQQMDEATQEAARIVSQAKEEAAQVIYEAKSKAVQERVKAEDELAELKAQKDGVEAAITHLDRRYNTQLLSIHGVLDALKNELPVPDTANTDE